MLPLDNKWNQFQDKVGSRGHFITISLAWCTVWPLQFVLAQSSARRDRYSDGGELQRTITCSEIELVKRRKVVVSTESEQLIQHSLGLSVHIYRSTMSRVDR